MRKRWLAMILITIGLAAVGLGIWAFSPGKGQVTAKANLVSELSTNQGYKRVEGIQTLVFPRDHGPHPEYQTEWWYYTGNLDSADGRHFGYQLTFFRRAAAPLTDLTVRQSDWATSQVYMAHFALTDVSGEKFQSYEKFSRGSAGLAGASGDPTFQVWLDNWQVIQTGENQYHLTASEAGIALDLTLNDLKGPILEGDQGYSQKGPDAGNASTYYSETRLATDGTVTVNGSNYTVNGLSWMDHEFSTSALSQGQVGWDWFSIQLDDGTELMLFNIRREDGSIDPYSSGSYILADGTVQHLNRKDFDIQATGTWTSPRSGGKYPSSWQIRIAELGLTLGITPYLKDQEHALSYAYWEGAVKIQWERDGKTGAGAGYTELTGYADSMAGDF